jgi:hypothetical protein
VVVPNEAGNGFDTVTSDHGKFKSLSGDQLTITEGTQKATYKDQTLTIPASAKIYRNGASAHLSDLRSGDEVNVIQGPKGTMVDANDAQHQETRMFGVRRFGAHMDVEKFGPMGARKLHPPQGGAPDLPPPPGA